MVMVTVLVPSPLALAGTALTVQVVTGGETTTVADYSNAELGVLPQKQLRYSSLDATSSPVVIVSEGVTIDTLLKSLDIPTADVVSVRLESPDGWKRSFSADEYLRTVRYYYSGIVDGYDTESTNPPQFALDTDKTKLAVATMLALKSYEGRLESSPDAASMTTSNCIRFCYGQTDITDPVMLSYGKHINRVIFVLKDSTIYTPSAESSDGNSSTPTTSAGVAEEIENAGLAADTLTITVGYYGGTYYTKKVFSLADLQAMQQVKQVYSYLDNMPAVCLDSAVGVRLTDILESAGIDVNSIQSFHFYCTDVARTWYLSVNKDYLLDTIRYYYPSLPKCWNYDEAEATLGATNGAVQVDTIIAFQDNWRRFATKANFDQSTDSTCFRLLFGQTDVKTPTSSRSAKWVHTIAVTLGGTPPAGITLDVSALKLKVGSKFHLNANLKVENNTTDQRVTWSSSDPSIVSVDSNGRIKVLAEGKAVVTATTVVGGLTASVVINDLNDSETKGKTDATKVDDKPAKSGKTGDKSAKTISVLKVNDGILAKTSSESDSRVQNWRVYEMSESGFVLADIKLKSNSLILFTTIMAVLLLLFGGIVQTIYYLKQL